MKKPIALLTAFLTFGISAFCQKLTISEMIDKTSCKTFNCFGNFVTTKGFSFYQVLDIENLKYYSYLSEEQAESSHNTKNTTSITIPVDGGNERRVSMTTNDRIYYSELIKQMTAKGFIEKSSETTDDGKLRVIYNSKLYKNFSIKILIQKLTTEGYSWTNYDIEVRNFY